MFIELDIALFLQGTTRRYTNGVLLTARSTGGSVISTHRVNVVGPHISSVPNQENYSIQKQNACASHIEYEA